MPRALIAALLLVGCSEVEVATLGSDSRDAGVAPLDPCDLRELYADLQAKSEAGDFPSSCALEPLFDPECPFPRLYRAVTKCLSDLAGNLPTSINNDRDD